MFHGEWFFDSRAKTVTNDYVGVFQDTLTRCLFKAYNIYADNCIKFVLFFCAFVSIVLFERSERVAFPFATKIQRLGNVGNSLDALDYARLIVRVPFEYERLMPVPATIFGPASLTVTLQPFVLFSL